MISATLQISLPIVLCWRTAPLTSSVIARVGVDRALGGAADRADRRRLVEALADAPRPALLLRLALQVAARHVEADGVAPDVAASRRPRRCRGRRVPIADDELDLVVQVLGQARVGMRPISPSATGSTASAGFMKKNGGSRPVKPISCACST